MKSILNNTDRVRYVLFMAMFAVMPGSFGIQAGAAISINVMARIKDTNIVTYPFGYISLFGLSLWVTIFTVLTIAGIFSRYKIAVKANIPYILLLLVGCVLGGMVVGLFMWFLFFLFEN
ncbi:MAG: hypothetical protein KJ063_25920 [Anaerolineae bacterium]|nr:hypothetical protein [Anaerolineae bacterium]